MNTLLKRSACLKINSSDVFFLRGFDVNQIIDFLSFPFLLTHNGLNFNEKYLNDYKIKIYHVFF